MSFLELTSSFLQQWIRVTVVISCLLVNDAWPFSADMELTIQGKLPPPPSSLPTTTTTTTLTITCTFPPLLLPSSTSPSPDSLYSIGLSIERSPFFSTTNSSASSRPSGNRTILVDIPGTSSGREDDVIARDVSGLLQRRVSSVAGSLYEGRAVLVLKAPTCDRDSGRYFCASNGGTKMKELHLLPDSVNMTSVLENVTEDSAGQLTLVCSVYSTTEIWWQWAYQPPRDDVARWVNVGDYVIIDDEPDVTERCRLPWTSRLTFPLGSRLLWAKNSVRCRALYVVGEDGEKANKTAVYSSTGPNATPTLTHKVPSRSRGGEGKDITPGMTTDRDKVTSSLTSPESGEGNDTITLDIDSHVDRDFLRRRKKKRSQRRTVTSIIGCG